MKGEDYQRFLTHAIEADSNDKDLNKYLDEKIYDLYDLLNLLFEVNILENMNKYAKLHGSLVQHVKNAKD